MPRLLFEKTGSAVWMSHLDLMRVFQRSFKRAGLLLKHTQGFNPRPAVSIALPLSVGVESHCELLDFDLERAEISLQDVCDRLNNALVSGIRVSEVYAQGRKLRDLSLLRCNVTLKYDSGVTQDTLTKISQLFTRDMLMVEKKTKSGIQEQDIIPMIRELTVNQIDGKSLLIDALICCQNPTLNPAQLVSAIDKYIPECKPDFSKCSRIEIYDKDKTVFR